MELHEQRYRIVKLLRKNFPEYFKGGFIPSVFANKKYPDAISNVPSDPLTYVKTISESSLVIYTRGLANSPAWKMAEYLSQGKVIIAENLTTELKYPLRHGVEVLFFNSDDELIENIRKVISNKKLANKLSVNARTYYENYVAPDIVVKRILNEEL